MDKAHTKTYFIKGFDSLNYVFMKMVFKNNEKPNSQTVEQETPPQTLNREESNLSELMFKQLLEHDDTDNYDYNEELVVMNQKKILDEEISVFSSLLKERKLKETSFSNRQFWMNQIHKLPNLCKLSLILSNIQCSSAFIERYFSICGIICKKRSMAMNDDLIVMRSLLKSNMELLKELNSINEN
jgi:hypothetical protein